MKKNLKKELLISEIKKAEKFAEKRDGVKAEVTGYGTDWSIDCGFATVTCEVCTKETNERLDDVELNIYVKDRRRSFAGDVVMTVFELETTVQEEQEEPETAETETEVQETETAEPENITVFNLDPMNLDKWMHQNKASYTGEYREGNLIDSFILSCKRGYAALYETYSNEWNSTYTVEFMPYKYGGGCEIFNRWAVRMW